LGVMISWLLYSFPPPSFVCATDQLSSSNSKPGGVDLLVILTVVGGVIDILGAALLLVVTSVSLSWLGILVGPGIVRLVFLILSALSLILLLYGVTSFFLAYGLWRGRGWAWTWALSSAIIGFAASITALGVGIGVIGVASNALTIYYLTRIEVKAFFGKAPLSESRNFSSLPSTVERFCVHCGNRLNGKEVYCPSCGSRSEPRFG
jgi:hypothetical protein